MKTGNYNHTNIGKNGDISCKICHFYKCVATSLLKSSLRLPFRYLWANDYKGKGISGRDHYIFCSRVMEGDACAA